MAGIIVGIDGICGGGSDEGKDVGKEEGSGFGVGIDDCGIIGNDGGAAFDKAGVAGRLVPLGNGERGTPRFSLFENGEGGKPRFSLFEN